MPKEAALQRARRDASAGKKPSIQAGEFVREEMHSLRAGSGNVRTRQQAIAIGLSEARRAGVRLDVPKGQKLSVRHKASRDLAIGQGLQRVSPARSRRAKQAARTRQLKYPR